VAKLIENIRDLADVESIEKTSLSEQNLPNSGYDAIARWAEKTPDKIAIYGLRTGTADEVPSTLTYREFFQQMNQFANLMNSLGVGPEDTISLLLPIIPEAHICLWGGSAAGIVNPINSFLEVDHLVGILKSARAKVIVGCHPSISPDGWGKIETIKDQLPDLKTIIQIGGERRDFDGGVMNFESAIAGQPNDRLLNGRKIHPDDIAAYFHTGGTTGVPKLARHTHKGHMLHSFVLSKMLAPEAENTSLVGVPLFHVGGATCGGLYPLSYGQSVVMLHPDGFRSPIVIRDFYRNAERFGATSLGGVPAIWSALLNIPSDGIDLGKVTYAMVGGAPLSVEVAKAVNDKLGLPMVEGWGMTETHGFAAYTPLAGRHKVGSVGIRTPYTEMKIVELDSAGGVSRECNPDEIGVLLVRGPQIIAGYLDDRHNVGSWVNGDWLNTGDLARIDEDGYLWITGRAKDTIIRGGHNIDPALIEDVLYAHEGIELAAAIGRPDQRVGEIPVAFVQMKTGVEFNEDDLKDYVRDRIQERAANPAEIVAVEEMPLTGVGKIFKPALRLDITQRIFQRELEAAVKSGVSISVSVNNHKVYGTMATIKVSADDPERAEAAALLCEDRLAGYAVRFEVTTS